MKHNSQPQQREESHNTLMEKNLISVRKILHRKENGYERF